MEKAVKQKLFLIIFIFLLVRLPGLGNDISNTDAYRWHLRSQYFLHALKSFEIAETYQHYQPGVSLMWINAFYKQLLFTFEYHILNNPVPPTLENSDDFPTIHGQSKALLVVVLSILLFLQMKLIYSLVNLKTALIFGFIASMEPYLVGIDRWFHLTSLESYFVVTSILYLLHWKYSNKASSFIFSSFFVAIAILSKLSALVVFIPILFVFLLVLKPSTVQDFLKYILLSFLFVFLMFPALWVSSAEVFSKLFHAVSGAISEEHYQRALPLLTKIFYYDLILLLKLSPLLFFLFLLSLRDLVKNVRDPVFSTFLVLLLSYYLALTFSAKKIDRYAVTMFLPLIILTSYYLQKFALVKLKILAIIHIAFFLIITYIYFPVYSAYYSFGTRSALALNLYDNSGEYFAQAARYLNTLGREKTVFVPNGLASFRYYYKGHVTDKIINNIDYEVISIDQDRAMPFPSICPELKAVFGPKSTAIVYVYSCEMSE